MNTTHIKLPTRKISCGNVTVEVFNRKQAIDYILDKTRLDYSEANLSDEDLWGELCALYGETEPLNNLCMLSVPDIAQTQQFWDEQCICNQENVEPYNLEPFRYSDFYL